MVLQRWKAVFALIQHVTAFHVQHFQFFCFSSWHTSGVKAESCHGNKLQSQQCCMLTREGRLLEELGMLLVQQLSSHSQPPNLSLLRPNTADLLLAKNPVLTPLLPSGCSALHGHPITAGRRTCRNLSVTTCFFRFQLSHFVTFNTHAVFNFCLNLPRSVGTFHSNVH